MPSILHHGLHRKMLPMSAITVKIVIPSWLNLKRCNNLLNPPQWLLHPATQHPKRETEKNMGTYGMRPNDGRRVSEMRYMLIVVWLYSPKVVWRWLLVVAWCSSVEQDLAVTEAHDDWVLPRPGPCDWSEVLKPGSPQHGELPQYGAQLGSRITGTGPSPYCIMIHFEVN